jgi:type IV secretory pathway component VirB8
MDVILAGKENGETKITEQFKRRRRARSYAIAAILLALVALFYVVTMVKIGQEIALN